MIDRGDVKVFLRGVFSLGLLFFVFSILTPWVVKWRPSLVPWRFVGEEFYWFFQVVFYPYNGGYRFGDLGFGREKLVLWDFWFARDTYYYGFAFEWIRLFIFQLSTVFSGIFLLVKGWTKTSYLLIPLTFSTLSVLVGIIQINRFAFVWNGYCHLVGGFVFAILATLCFLSVIIIKRISQRLSKEA